MWISIALLVCFVLFLIFKLRNKQSRVTSLKTNSYLENNPSEKSLNSEPDIAPLIEKKDEIIIVPPLPEDAIIETYSSITDPLPDYDPKLDLREYQYPTLDLLIEYTNDTITNSPQSLEDQKSLILQTLKKAGISTQSISAAV